MLDIELSSGHEDLPDKSILTSSSRWSVERRHADLLRHNTSATIPKGDPSVPSLRRRSEGRTSSRVGHTKQSRGSIAYAFRHLAAKVSHRDVHRKLFCMTVQGHGPASPESIQGVGPKTEAPCKASPGGPCPLTPPPPIAKGVVPLGTVDAGKRV